MIYSNASPSYGRTVKNIPIILLTIKLIRSKEHFNNNTISHHFGKGMLVTSTKCEATNGDWKINKYWLWMRNSHKWKLMVLNIFPKIIAWLFDQQQIHQTGSSPSNISNQSVKKSKPLKIGVNKSSEISIMPFSNISSNKLTSTSVEMGKLVSYNMIYSFMLINNLVLIIWFKGIVKD